ncbi:MAG: methyltransferase [Bacteroidetes bacterium]|nr:methyltransferase [Bacteroidota bacterium]
MQLSAAISLLQHPVTNTKSNWADLGCGEGLFSLALSHLLPPGSYVNAIDKNVQALKNVVVKDGIHLKKYALDFIQEELPVKELDGILMANSFHYVRNREKFINKVFQSLKRDGSLIFVEYDTDTPNNWVPYPVSFESLKKFFAAYQCTAEKIHEIQSVYQRRIYAAIIYCS